VTTTYKGMGILAPGLVTLLIQGGDEDQLAGNMKQCFGGGCLYIIRDQYFEADYIYHQLSLHS
jgi:hypothetical protein